MTQYIKRIEASAWGSNVVFEDVFYTDYFERISNIVIYKNWIIENRPTDKLVPEYQRHSYIHALTRFKLLLTDVDTMVRLTRI